MYRLAVWCLLAVWALAPAAHGHGSHSHGHPSAEHKCIHDELTHINPLTAVHIEETAQAAIDARQASSEVLHDVEDPQVLGQVDTSSSGKVGIKQNYDYMRIGVKYIKSDAGECTRAGQTVSIGTNTGIPCSTTVTNNCEFTCSAEDVMTTAKTNFLTSLVAEATAFLSKHLKVVRLTAPLPVAQSPFCTSGTPWAYPDSEVPDTDFILYVTTRPTTGSTLAFASTCQIDGTTGRPTVGWANFGPARISTEDSGAVVVAIHEITHALGFSYQNGFLRFQNGNSGAVLRTDTKTNPNSGASYEVQKIITPKVLEYARSHFSCPTLDGVEIEDGGGSGTALSHWERRLFGTEFMVGVKQSSAVFGPITFWALEDSGWYKADVTGLSDNPFGQGKGCQFTDAMCDSAAWKSWGLPYTCAVNQQGCTNDLSGTGQCDLGPARSSLPGKYAQSGGVAGTDELNDYCPTFYPLKICANPGEAYYQFSQQSSVTAYLDYRGSAHGAAARCMTNNLASEDVVATSRPAGGDTYMCHKFACKGSTLMVKIGSHYHACTSAGAQITDPISFKGTLTCPDPKTLCISTVSSTGSDPWPVFTSIEPKGAKPEAGTAFTITGSNIDSSTVTAVILSGVPATNLAYSGGTTVTGKTGSGSYDGRGWVQLLNGNADISVTSPPDTFSVTTDSFTSLKCGPVACYLLAIIIGVVLLMCVIMCCCCKKRRDDKAHLYKVKQRAQHRLTKAQTGGIPGKQGKGKGGQFSNIHPGAAPAALAGKKGGSKAAQAAKNPVQFDKRAQRAAVAARQVDDATSTKQLAMVFKKLDKDKSGYLSPNELKAFMLGLSDSFTDDQIEFIFSVADEDGDGRISLNEFTKLIAANALGSRIEDGSNVREIRAAFDMLDRDGNGFLTPNEVQVFMQGIMTAFFDPQDVLDFILENDENGDGMIDFDEFQKLMTAAKSARSLEAFNLRQIKKKFKKLDSDGNGTLSPSEIRVFLTNMHADGQPPPTADTVNTLIKMADADGDGNIDFREFVKLLESMQVAREIDTFDTSMLRRRFKLLDRSGDGYLQADEVKVFMQCLNPNVKAAAAIDSASVNNMLKSMDTDGDGQISIDEFLRAMKKIQAANAKGKGGAMAHATGGGGRGGRGGRR
eukprot:TRINITY_DN800_c0_g4_i1.p1 TRINITY_DN800_c0_g4~~TRINITY_DN800_c0_g4_i1.p1  ORF type:complete len:1244 (-),score=362.25 TRINITY_DN800_c0_g4_i1:154-3567(-)